MSFARGIRLAGFARRHLGRMTRGRHEVMAHLEAPRAENLPMPTFVQLRVTNLCNLRCKMCGQWGDTGIFRDGFSASATDGEQERSRIKELIGFGRQLSLADYVRLLDEIANVEDKPIVSLFGGEPLLYPDILPLVHEIKKRGLTCTVITNGNNHLKVYIGGSVVVDRSDLTLGMPSPFNAYLEPQTSYAGQMLVGTYTNYYATTSENVNVQGAPAGGTAKVVDPTNKVLASAPIAAGGTASIAIGQYQMPIAGSVQVFDPSNTLVATSGAKSIWGGDAYHVVASTSPDIEWLKYTLEQLLEHAIVHILRHRRQIERWGVTAG